jgi:hypothetical protein
MKKWMVFGVMIIEVNPPFRCGFMRMVLSLPVTCNGSRGWDINPGYLPSRIEGLGDRIFWHVNFPYAVMERLQEFIET